MKMKLFFSSSKKTAPASPTPSSSKTPSKTTSVSSTSLVTSLTSTSSKMASVSSGALIVPSKRSLGNLNRTNSTVSANSANFKSGHRKSKSLSPLDSESYLPFPTSLPPPLRNKMTNNNINNNLVCESSASLLSTSGTSSNSSSNSSLNSQMSPSDRLLNSNGYALMDEILARGTRSMTFLAYHCQRSFCEEVVTCLIHMMAFQTCSSHTTEEELQVAAKEIHKFFLTKGSREEVNLSSEVLNLIYEAFNNGTVTKDTFNAAILELRQLLLPHVNHLKNAYRREITNMLVADGILA